MRTKEAYVTIAALLAGGAAAWLAAHRTFEPYQTARAPLALLVGWSFVGSGLAARRVHPDSPLGKVMILTGFAWFASFLTDAQQSLLFSVGTAVQSVYLVGFLYLVLTFPSGRPRTGFERFLIWSGVAVVTVVAVASLVFSDSHAVLCKGCPGNALEVARDDALANALIQFERIGGVVVVFLALALIVVRWSRASAVRRRTSAPVVLGGGVTLAVLVVSVVNDALSHPLGQAPKDALFVALATLPVGMVLVLLQRRLARAAVAGLVVELGEPNVAKDLRGALARALGDPSLEVAYWYPQAARYVGADGRPVELPAADSVRACTTVVERDGQPVAAIIHDSGLRENAELIDSVCAAAAMTLENERLQAELRARLGELKASRARLVGATEAERRRIERDLHDGTQQRLVSLAMSLGLLDTKLSTDPEAAKPIAGEARVALAEALQELRDLSQGIHPATLTDRGLAAALEELADRAALPTYVEVSVNERPCPAVEAAAYFLVSEALTNAAKHSHAGEVRVSASRDQDLLVVEVSDDGIGGAVMQGGSGLRGLMDRVEALDGTLLVSSPPGRGTRLRAELPCA